MQKEHPLLLAHFTELTNALNNQPITGQVTHYNDVSVTFASKTTKQDHTSIFSKLVEQTNHSMLILMLGRSVEPFAVAGRITLIYMKHGRQ